MQNRSHTSEEFFRITAAGTIQKMREFLDAQQSSDELIQSTMASIQKLNFNNTQRLKQHIDNMLFEGTLTLESLQQAIARVTFKIPAVPESRNSTSNKRGRQRRGHILYTNSTNSLTFFMNQGASKQEDDFGGQSKISKGYASADARDPAFTVKRYCLGDANYSRPAKELAAHEIKFSQHLGRKAAIYQSKKGPVIFTDYQPGDDLQKMIDQHARFSDYSYERRFKWLSSLIEDIEILHVSGHLYADLKPGNCVLNLNTDSMKLIDFGSAQKVDSKKTYCATPGFIDPKEGSPKKLASDMYAFGFIISCLFPELFVDDFLVLLKKGNFMGIEVIIPVGAKHVSEKRKDVAFTDTDRAILSLYDAVMESAQADRCTSQQVKLFCHTFRELLSTKKQIDKNELDHLLSATINRNTFEVEDALRGSRRPAKFGATAKKREAVTPTVETDSDQTKKNKVDEAQSSDNEDPGTFMRIRF